VVTAATQKDEKETHHILLAREKVQILNTNFDTGNQWLTPIILAMQEAEIRRIKI
jgi:hypothetical protein